MLYLEWIDRRERFSLSSISVKMRRANTSMSSKILNIFRIFPIECWYLLMASSWSISQILFSAFRILWYALCCLLCCFLVLAPETLKITFSTMRLASYYAIKWTFLELTNFNGLVSQSRPDAKWHKFFFEFCLKLAIATPKQSIMTQHDYDCKIILLFVNCWWCNCDILKSIAIW